MSFVRTWSDLRRTRSTLPGAARLNVRRGETYVAALEQAEQLFRAAKESTPATSPLLLYYGISQLGRALAAASPTLDNDEYRLRGHGLSSPEDSWTGFNLEKVRVQSPKKQKQPAAFQRVAEVLGACSFQGDPRTLDEIMNLLAFTEPGILPEKRDLLYPPLGVDLTSHGSGSVLWSVGPQRAQIYVAGIPRSIIPFDSLKALDSYIEEDSEWEGNTARERLDNFFAKYPTLKGIEIATGESETIAYYRFLPPLLDFMQILVTMPLEEGEPSVPIPSRFSVFGLETALACPDGCGKPDHPFTLWWAVLYTFSMLARYAPSEWRRMIDVDSSTSAVRIEQILSASVHSVPAMAVSILRGIERGQ